MLILFTAAKLGAGNYTYCFEIVEKRAARRNGTESRRISSSRGETFHSRGPCKEASSQ